MTLLAIDPGPTESAYVLSNDALVAAQFGKIENPEILRLFHSGLHITDCVCERVRSFGMPVGAETFETCEWSGRFQESSRGQGIRWHWLTRKEVVMHLCNHPRGNDASVRQALIDRFGPGKQVAIGNKKAPGPLWGITGDCWSALAVAVTCTDTLGEL